MTKKLKQIADKGSQSKIQGQKVADPQTLWLTLNYYKVEISLERNLSLF